MKKNLLNKEAAEQMIERVNQLSPENAAAWGRMNATEMLLHCNLANLQILEGDIAYSKDTAKQKLLKVLALYMVRNFPKHMKSHPRIDTKGKICDNDFEKEQERFISVMSRFAERKESIQLTHPAFGNLNTKQWGIAAWKHTDHHLRQFGV